MHLAFLTPLSGLVALLVGAPLATYVLSQRLERRVQGRLGLRSPPRARRLAPAVALVLAFLLIGSAAAQPVIQHGAPRHERTDAQAYVVFDISLSMAASRGLHQPNRLDRARAFALALRSRLPTIPVGAASMTDRLLPLLFPTADEAAFDSVVRRAVAINSPQPERFYADRATVLDSLASLATSSYFDPGARHRAVVVLTDGESQPIVPSLARALGPSPRIHVVFVHVARDGDKLYTTSVPDPNYHADPASGEFLKRAASALHGTAVSVDDVRGGAAAVRRALGDGPVRTVQQPARLALMPYVTLAAFVPLAFLLWRRNV